MYLTSLCSKQSMYPSDLYDTCYFENNKYYCQDDDEDNDD